MSERRRRASRLKKSFLIIFVLALGFTSGVSAAPDDVGPQAPAFQDPDDLDNDGIENLVDNCPLNFNPNQEDTNGDGIGDACDLDNDGIENLVDNCPLVYNAGQLDTDGDAAGDACDNGYDQDLDGIYDGVETHLINTFAPIVWLHSEDPYRPAGVEWLFQRSDAPLKFHFGIWPAFCDKDDFYGLTTLNSPIGDGINLLGIKTQFEWYSEGAGCMVLPESSDLSGVSMHYAIDMEPVAGFHWVYLGDDPSSAPFYATVARGVFPNTFSISYWFFYPYNGCGYDQAMVEYCNWVHEGDWEHIVVWVHTDDGGATYQPLLVDYYYHGELDRYLWSDITALGNRPVVFSAKQTHASYPEEGWNYSCVAEDDLGSCWYWRLDYTDYGPLWDPLAPGGKGIINVGERPLNRSRDYFDPSMGVPLPDSEWILYGGTWGLDGPGTPSFRWYEGQDGIYPPTVWKVPDQTASTGIDKEFSIGPIAGFPGTTLVVGIDWGDGTAPTTSPPLGDHFYHMANHTYAAPGEYIVNVVVIDQIFNLWGGNIFKVTVTDGPVITSASSTTFTVGSSGSFTVTTSGVPPMSIASSGALPSGVTFVDNGDGTATLAGPPAAGEGGVYSLDLTASDGIGAKANQTFTLTVDSGAPAITSTSITAFPVGSSGSFTVTTSGIPVPSIAYSGALPSGVTFVDNGDGTGTLSGPPSVDSEGIYQITFTASNGVSPDSIQNFTLNVTLAPVITSADTAAFAIGQANSFTVSAAGFPLPTFGGEGALPDGVTFVDNGDGTATLAGIPAAGADGVYYLVLTASNGIGIDASQTFTLTVNSVTAPETGFAPGAFTRLPEQPASTAYTALGGLWLEIPALGVQAPIVGVPIGERTWDVTWLHDQVGWLEGTAFPTWAGNSTLTAHAYTADGLPGPFTGLGSLAYNDLIVVHMDGMRYTYALRTNDLVYADNNSYITRHEEYSWLTLVTCEQYDERTGSFPYRRVVRAVLISATPEY
jgi:LPXTG-site transpeptidase (sortase) family protein